MLSLTNLLEVFFIFLDGSEQLSELVNELLADKSLEQRGLFDPSGVRQLIADNQDQRYDASYTIFSLMCIELWCRMFLDKTVPSVD